MNDSVLAANRDVPLVVIAGATASGKSALAMQLAERFGGEIVSADSRAVYAGMDIGTAKPSASDRARVRHHLLDIAAPDQPISAAAYKRLALAALHDIGGRRRLPILVGGSGLYIDAVVADFQFGEAADPSRRQHLQTQTIAELQAVIKSSGWQMPANASNRRHLIRTIETGGRRPAARKMRANTLLLGINLPPEQLRLRIVSRAEQMIQQGVADEAKRLATRYGWETEALLIPAYRALRPYLEGSISLSQATERCIAYDLAYAKRQRTWFKRNKSIHWLSNRDNYQEAVELITTFLNK